MIPEIEAASAANLREGLDVSEDDVSHEASDEPVIQVLDWPPTNANPVSPVVANGREVLYRWTRVADRDSVSSAGELDTVHPQGSHRGARSREFRVERQARRMDERAPGDVVAHGHFGGQQAAPLRRHREDSRQPARQPIALSHRGISEMGRGAIEGRERHAGDIAPVAQERLTCLGRRDSDGPLRQQNPNETKRDEHSAARKHLDVEDGKTLLAVEPGETYFHEDLSGIGKPPVEAHLRDAVRVCSEVAWNLRRPLKQRIVGDGMGGRIEEALVEMTARNTSAVGMKDC